MDVEGMRTLWREQMEQAEHIPDRNVRARAKLGLKQDWKRLDELEKEQIRIKQQFGI